MLTIKDIKLGRMSFPTVEEGFKEAVGDSLDVVGAGLTASERKPRPLDLAIPVRASSKELDPYAEGDRMRRQVRSLMENPAARLSGLYLQALFDSEINGWALIGGGTLEYGEGGLAFADYKLSLSDSFIVGRRRTHRPARRVMAYDRRLSTTPRDYERLVYSTSFAATLAVVEVALPHGASDVRARSVALAEQVRTMPTADGGNLNIYSGNVNGDVLSFEQPETGEGVGDVIIYDRRGNKSPAEVVRTNLLLYPSAESSAAGVVLNKVSWAEGEIKREENSTSFSDYGDGEWAFRVKAKKDATVTGRTLSVAQTTAVGAITPGLPYSLSVPVEVLDQIGNGFAVRIDWYTAGLAYISSTATSAGFLTTGESRIALANQIAPATASVASVILVGTSAVSGDTVDFWTDSWMLEQSATVGSYFDGDTLWGTWSGVAGESTSTLLPEPEESFGWEEVYGADYPLTKGDPPVLQNGICRLRYVTAPVPCFALDQFSGGLWVEQARIAPSTAGVTPTALLSAVVKEWTPERGVVFCRFQCGPTRTVDMYYILQRGWGGPRVETYTRAGVAEQAGLYYYPQDANEMLFAKSDQIAISTEAWSASMVWAENIEPWGVLAPLAGGGIHHRFAAGTSMTTTLSSSASFHGSTRKGVQFRGSSSSTTATGWCGMNMEMSGSVKPKVFEADSYTNSGPGTALSIADAEAGNGAATRDTQAAETNASVLEPVAGTSIGLIAGWTYAIWARVRVSTAGTVSVRGLIGTSSGSIKTSTSTTYVWVNLGNLIKPLANSRFQINAWRSAGTGNAMVDKVAALPLSGPTEEGIADFGSASLMDSQGLAELVSR